MPTLEEIYEKLCVLESEYERSGGLSPSDDVVVDFFNQDTVPGNEVLNSGISFLENVEISQSHASIIDSNSPGRLEATPKSLNVEEIQTVMLKVDNENVVCDYVVDSSSTVNDIHENVLEASTVGGVDVEVVPYAGDSSYGARLQTSSDVSVYQTRQTFEVEDDKLWFMPKSNVLLTYGVGGTNLLCEVSEPLHQFPLPQYSLLNFAVGLWTDVVLLGASEISASMKTVAGSFVRMGFALNMEDNLNGYLLLLESDINGSWIRFYSVKDGLIELVAEQVLAISLALDVEYELLANFDGEFLSVELDGSVVLQYTLSGNDLIEYRGMKRESGVAVMATSSVEFGWVETKGVYEPINVASEGSVLFEVCSSGSDILSWENVELESSVVSGRVELDYSIDNGVTFQPVPMAIIEYPSPVTKRFNIDFIPVQNGVVNSIVFRARLYDTASGWVKRLHVFYEDVARPAYELNNIELDSYGRFVLPAGELSGTVTTTESFVPDQLIGWESFISDSHVGVSNVPVLSITSMCTVTVDSFQVGHEAQYIVDSDINSYWESLRDKDSYMMFEFPDEMELHGFRWVKKALIEGAVYYQFQVFDEVAGNYRTIHSFGYESNADVEHMFPEPVIGKKFRIWIDCVQPASRGNARFVDLFGRTSLGETGITYDYSLDSGVTWNTLVDPSDLASWVLVDGLTLRASLSRTDISADLFLRKLGVRFRGRSSLGNQITDILYDVSIGNLDITNIKTNQEIDVRGVEGNVFVLNARFLVNPNYVSEMLKPSFGGYKFFAYSSHLQAHVNNLLEQINGVISAADGDVTSDSLLDAIMVLIRNEIHQTSILGESDSGLNNILNAMATEISKLRTMVRYGDVGHLDEVLPSIVRNVNIFE